MAILVVNTASISCSFGTTPGTLNVPPQNRTNSSSNAIARISNNITNTNIMPFGMCSSMANPTVSAATASAQGVLTPQTCVPVPVSPWAPGSPTVQVGGQPALNNNSRCTCSWGGVISITNAGQASTNVA
ncbi:MAG: DUF4280 domain-containing protein [Gammaproteobacteria bacterium]|nr:DUF4280 domain-containing protein [Gammaproteobacteria bacterium]